MVTTFTNLKNNAATVLNTSIDSAVTTIQAVAGGGNIFPATPFYLSCEYEVMKCTGRSTDTLTVVRGQDGTTAASHPAGAVIEQRNNAAMWTDIANAVTQIENGTTNIPFNPPAGSVTNSLLGPDVARPNFAQNGGFELWPGGTGPITSTGQGSYTTSVFASHAWQICGLGGSSISVSRDTGNADGKGIYCAAVAHTYSGTADSGLFQILSSGVSSLLINSIVTFSARVKCSTASAVRLAIWNGTAYVYSANHTGNGTYQTLSVTATIGSGVTATPIVFGLMFTNVNATAYIDNATLVQGSARSDYQPEVDYPDGLPNHALSSDIARPNLLTNGAFQIWQRGTAFSNPHGVYVADKWQFATYAGTSYVSKQAASGATGYSLGLSSTPAAGTFTHVLYQAFESDQLAQLRGKLVTVSVTVYCDQATSALTLDMQDNVGTIMSSSLGPRNAWTRISATGLVPSGASALSVRVVVGGSVATNSYISEATLVVGTVPTDIIPMHPADELAQCRRYYHRRHATITMNPGTGMQINGTAANIVVPFQVAMGGAPTVTVSAPGDWQFVAGGGGGIVAVALNAVYATAISCMLGGSASGFTAGHATYLQNTNGNAMINTEWNP